jgi:hypothetical protein
VDHSVDEAAAAWRARVDGEFQAYAIDATHQSIVLDTAQAGAIAQIINHSLEPSDSLSELEGPNSDLLKPIGLGERNG